MKIIRFFFFIFLSFFLSNSDIFPENMSPVGLWKTIDDDTKELKSIVRIWNEDGILKGRIEKIFPKPGEDPDPKCDKCKGDKKNKRVIGMIFLWGFSQSGKVWAGGKILDPENGKTYHCRLKVTSGGKRMNVFGYIRLIIRIGRTQTWLRAEESDLLSE